MKLAIGILVTISMKSINIIIYNHGLIMVVLKLQYMIQMIKQVIH